MICTMPALGANYWQRAWKGAAASAAAGVGGQGTSSTEYAEFLAARV